MGTGSLVFAGGGVAGIAWELGVVQGLLDADPALVDRLLAPSTRFIGTSAGSAVAAQLAGTTGLTASFAAQLEEETAELGADVDVQELQARFLSAVQGATSPTDALQRIGRLALETPSVDESVRLEVIRSRLADSEWPERDLRITAVEVERGEFVVFDRSSGVDLVDAIAASCAVPGVWPPVTIGGSRYMDGGARSGSNADLAAGSDWVVIVTPLPGVGDPGVGTVPTAELEALGGVPTAIVYADAASITAFGPNPLDPTTRRASAEAGRAVGRASAARIAAVLDQAH
ncbi:patatin-like phospholipase family protein [Agreia sp. PsM10]|uniref:patatin-like phospholipase family protein n=1 Tax=Agreia sp. PsM10 TaxID=3030533 RepID=UPI00263ADBE8|nr:patatin-like phospholipase family protein [Agreia sp. PsM10]MDN4641403.1 patatin-like phospholipase family protein [Agreia sp. PsM10]